MSRGNWGAFALQFSIKHTPFLEILDIKERIEVTITYSDIREVKKRSDSKHKFGSIWDAITGSEVRASHVSKTVGSL